MNDTNTPVPSPDTTASTPPPAEEKTPRFTAPVRRGIARLNSFLAEGIPAEWDEFIRTAKGTRKTDLLKAFEWMAQFKEM